MIRSNSSNQLLGDNTNYVTMVDETIRIFDNLRTKNDKYLILLTNGIGTKTITEQGRIEYSEDEIEDLSNRLRGQNIRVIPVAVTEKCTAEQATDKR